MCNYFVNTLHISIQDRSLASLQWEKVLQVNDARDQLMPKSIKP